MKEFLGYEIPSEDRLDGYRYRRADYFLRGAYHRCGASLDQYSMSFYAIQI